MRKKLLGVGAAAPWLALTYLSTIAPASAGIGGAAFGASFGVSHVVVFVVGLIIGGIVVYFIRRNR
jgi:hypothetical protein